MEESPQETVAESPQESPQETDEVKLGDMPWHIKQKIVNSVDEMTTTFSLRRCSKEFKTCADRVPTKYRQMEIIFGSNNIKISLESSIFWRVAVYTARSPTGYSVKSNTSLSKGDTYETRVEGVHFAEGALARVMKILGNPNLKSLYVLKISTHDDKYEWPPNQVFHRWFLFRLSAELAQLPFKIPVSSFYLQHHGGEIDVLCVLPHLDPRTLYELILHRHGYDDEDKRKRIVVASPMQFIIHLEQWKQLHTLRALGFDLELEAEHYEQCIEVDVGATWFSAEFAKDVADQSREDPDRIAFRIVYNEADPDEFYAYLHQFPIKCNRHGYCYRDLGEGLCLPYNRLRPTSLRRVYDLSRRPQSLPMDNDEEEDMAEYNYYRWQETPMPVYSAAEEAEHQKHKKLFAKKSLLEKYTKKDEPDPSDA